MDVMKFARLMQVWLISVLPALSFAGGQKKSDLLMYHDDATGRDSVVLDAYLDLRYLYTDSLLVGFAFKGEDGLINPDSMRWVTQEKIGFFRHNNHLYAPLTLTTGDKPGTYFMRHYRDRKSRVKVYTMGKWRQRQYYALYPDSTVTEIPDMVEFRDQERLERTGNRNYIRGFHWGVLAGMIGNGNIQLDDYPMAEDQQGMTVGAWMDWPIYRHGASLHAKVMYHAMSAKTQRRGVAWAYNRKGLDVPLSLRYTCLPIPYRLIPFVEGGVNFRLALKNSAEGISNRFELRPDGQKYPTSALFLSEQQGNRCAVAPVLGGGLRYRVTDTRHVMLTFNYYLNSVMAHYELDAASFYQIYDVTANGWSLSLCVGLW